ncbi:hypothetical protein [Hoeflea ulvae]|uniref:DUF2254 domain-containing protein n=1 Tax=Hoeflea ulvae TaxID=2983764 RepID=A0ABT3YHT4_9HYPH|nr:hypothetical protein [Hoeflea ulvae]MCY0095455.1 hypothetical protein [Hoeflea ulvae]
MASERLSAFRSLLVGIGASLIGATAIIFSVVMLAVQLNFARIPFGLFRRLSSDVPLLASFAATFIFGVVIGLCALLPDETWIAPAVIVSSWCMLAALALFFIAYKRALDLISPAKQMQIVLHKADRSMRRWEKRADRFAPFLENRPTPGVNRDIARASFFQLHPEWESDVREASSHMLAFARRYAEQGEYDVSAIALNGLVRINGRYISTRGDTFFASNPFFTNPLTTEALISDTLEKLRRLAMSAQGRSDEEQFIQVMSTLASLCGTYTHIDYGRKFNVELRHSQLAASYLTGVVEGAPRTFGPDVLMEGVRLLGQCALVLVQARRALGVITIAKSISTVALLGLVKPGHEPITSTAVQQLANLAFSMLRSEERDINFPSKEVSSSIRTIAHAVLLTADKPLASQHSAHLKPYYALTDYGTFGDGLRKLINAVIERPAVDDDAKRILDHLSAWSDGIHEGEKQLLLAAVNKQSFLALDLINWICHITKVLVVASTAPAASDHDRTELIRNAKRLIYVLDWLPDEKEVVAFVENFQFIEQLFEVTLEMHGKGEDEIAEAARYVLFRWSLKAGKYQTGWGSLARALTALCVLAVWKEGSGWVTWLKNEFTIRLPGRSIDEEIRKRAADDLREIAKNPSNDRYGLGSVGYHMSRVDRGRFAECMNAVADLLDPEAA